MELVISTHGSLMSVFAFKSILIFNFNKKWKTNLIKKNKEKYLDKKYISVTLMQS